MTRNFTGYHAALLLVAFFGTIMAVNFSMAWFAGHTFGGVVVENSYVASQKFNGWLEEAEADRALGWRVEPARDRDDRIVLETAGVPAGAEISAMAHHPLGREDDIPLAFVEIAPGQFRSNEGLPLGRWSLRMQINTSEHNWRGVAEVQ